MASVAGRRGGSSSSTVEIAILPTLKSCLVNLPSNLVYILLNQNTLAQNVVVELQHRTQQPAGAEPKARPPPPQSVFVGWTGMQSQARLTPVIGRDGVRSGTQEKEAPTVEIDAVFAKRLGITEGTKVRGDEMGKMICDGSG